MKNEELFSAQADVYAKYRPTYPQELYDFILQHIPHRDIAWDCGTGNGQAAVVLSDYFQKVFGTDISQKQLNNAVNKSNVQYINCPAEHTPFSENQFDLVTVAQAYHWLEFDQFKKEVHRVGKPGALLAVWSYGHIAIEPRIDELMRNFHDHIVGPYWDSRRKYVTNGLRDVPFFYPEIPSRPFSLELKWTLTDLEGYLESWSAVQTCKSKTGNDPVPGCIEKISEFWNDHESKCVTFPLTLRIGRIVK
jgi:SAM-dependent methyltransferase